MFGYFKVRIFVTPLSFPLFPLSNPHVASITEKICWWKVTGTQPTPRAHHSLVRTDTRLFLLGGKGTGNSILDEIWTTNTGRFLFFYF
jgi:hypothetical protein